MDYSESQECDKFHVFFFFFTRNVQTIRTMRSSAYLVSPPHHQVGESCNPADGTQECDGEELL